MAAKRDGTRPNSNLAARRQSWDEMKASHVERGGRTKYVLNASGGLDAYHKPGSNKK